MAVSKVVHPLAKEALARANQHINTMATSAGTSSVTPKNTTSNVNGNANIDPYTNAYNTYKTNLTNAKTAQLGQLNTEYNTQREQINSAANNLNRNAYVTYMNRALANRNTQANMGVTRSGAAENMNTANAVDYNRSVGNIGAYRVGQLSNAENSYNSQVANVENTYANQLAEAENNYNQARIDRENQLADAQAQRDFEAAENAKNRTQQQLEADRAYNQQKAEADRAYKQSVKEFNATKTANRFKVFQNTVSGYTTTKSINKAISKLKAAKKDNKLNAWQKEYYTEMMYTLKAQKNVVKQKAKAKKK